MWGPSGQINDYAKKEWGGLVRSYYKPRYALLFKMANAALAGNGGISGWDQRAYTSAMLTTVEEPWQTDRTSFPVEPEADALVVSKAMHAKYGGGQ